MSNTNAGRGGSYALNPATGELELVERTFDPAWDVPAEAAQDQPVSLPETPETDPPADAGAEA